MSVISSERSEEDDSNIEKKALDNLLRCSKRSERLEKSVSIKDWDAVSKWNKTRPMCYYTNHTPQKKSKKKNGRGKSSATSTMKNSKVQEKKYPPKEIKYFSKEKCKYFEIPLIKETLTDDYSKNINSMIRNKFSRSTNVLSYDTPSWRFLVDNKDFNYIERSTPREKVYNFLKRSKSSCIKNQQSRAYRQVLDPAGFLDEQIMVAYKSFRTFQPNPEIRQLLTKIDNINTQYKQNEIQNRLYVTSFIKKVPFYDGGGESDGNNEETNPQHLFIKTEPELQRTKKTVKKVKKKKKKKSSPPENKPFINTKNMVLPRITGKQKLIKDTHSLKSPLFLSKESLKTTKKDVSVTEELYLPLLNHSNYTNKIQYLKRPDVKLPAVAGVKISLSSTSHSGLVS